MSVSVEDALVHELRSAGCIFAEDEARLILAAASDRTNLVSMVQRRVSGVPLEHVLGWAEFCGLRIAVDAEVFVPRRRTEFLVDRAAALMREGAVVVDLCCGSGAVGVALAALIDSPELYAVDIDPAAVCCARRNMPAERVFEGDLYDPLPASLRGQVHVLVANAPYVPTEAIRLMPPEARLHEPRVSLDGGADGLHIQRRVAAGAQHWLAPGGHLLIETSESQATRTVQAFTDAGLSARVESSAELGATVVVGTRA
ncbi:putative protein N(5)-glutamine methyltransferase [Rhodococcus sp. MSC1_016]|jgi:release factor glutamine methyltransferase|uniref:putative protein N(5)-glutamine methyltransferase n=1 Tax=Rhodococcus sp. MSC1_016 TaxID=2909266 RepID=UPI00202E42CD|nr:putative protein N(5)-glutamine methyltransferase [Rhodococcus sp. MSC1_016]